eukprot:TRINITY_DN1668_c0_g1_i7.p2 TRINITY_DN1668_c0_g1~~TRINITY_DN1668_c0_g1_i7.p2  ORF type:complete len:237 (-),score=31.23 TRINITY_DN1668_c0_g1_i7:1226-1849(-)
MLHVKIVLLGDSHVGKTSIVQRYIHDRFGETAPTVGATYSSKYAEFPNLQTAVKFNLWDTAGEEKFRSLGRIYYQDALAAVLVFDMTDKDSYENTQRWMEEIRQHRGDEIVIILVGNKTDLLEAQKVSIEQATEYANKEGIHFLNCSAKDGVGINPIFEKIAIELTSKKDDPKSVEKEEKGSTIKISAKTMTQAKAKSDCCQPLIVF